MANNFKSVYVSGSDKVTTFDGPRIIALHAYSPTAGTFDITDSNFVPKPHLDSYKKLIEKFRLDPAQSILIEDIAHNLEQAKNLGMKTVWLENNEAFASKNKDKPYIDYKIKNLSGFLKEINILKAA